MLLSREELQERLLALHKASVALVEDVSLDHLLHQIAKIALEQSAADYAAVGVLDEKGGLTQFIPVGLTDKETKNIEHPPIGLGLIGALMQATDPIRIPSITDHPVSSGFPKDHPFMVPFLGVPIRSGDIQLGQIYLTKKEKSPEFTADDEKIIQILAAYAAAAIQNARLHENAQRIAIHEERERIGMDLHDGIIQSIYGLGLSLESALHTIENDPAGAKQHLLHAIDGLNQTIRDLRSYVLDLRPRQLGDEGLIRGINRLIIEFRTNTLADVYLTEPESELKNLPQTHELVLFHICQEALANIAKHAKAKKVQISVWASIYRVLLEVTDDGNGFDMDQMDISIGHGLANMRTRARAIGGDVDITSTLGEGTTILAWVPYTNRNK